MKTKLNKYIPLLPKKIRPPSIFGSGIILNIAINKFIDMAVFKFIAKMADKNFRNIANAILASGPANAIFPSSNSVNLVYFLPTL